MDALEALADAERCLCDATEPLLHSPLGSQASAAASSAPPPGPGIVADDEVAAELVSRARRTLRRTRVELAA